MLRTLHSGFPGGAMVAFTGISMAVGLLRSDPAWADDTQPNAVQSFFQKLNPNKPSTAAPTPAPATTAPQLPAGPPPYVRPEDSVKRLIAKGTVTGTDLLEELKEFRLAAGDRKARMALAGSVGSASATAMDQKNHLWMDTEGKVLDLFMTALKEQIASASYAAATQFMQTLTGDAGVLDKETIELPKSAATMKLPQQQSLLTMAALVIAARVTHRGLDAAQKDFKSIESEFESLLDRRQKTAALMADVLDRRRKAKAAKDEAEVRHMEADLGQWLSPADLAFIDSFGEDRPLRDFSNDLGMQNLALQFLRHSDPKAYEDFRTQTDGLVARSRAYLRTMTGIAAFGGFVALFTQDVVNATRDKDLGETLTVMPFAFQFAKEAGPLVKLSVQTLYTGVVIEPSRFSHNYRLVHGAQITELRHAKNVFEAMTAAGQGSNFADALFRNGAPGFIYHVYLCDPAEAGHLMDKAVPGKSREQFAESYLHASDSGGFLFANALAEEPQAQAVKLAEPLLSRDQRVRAEAVPLGEVQKLIAANYSEWDDSQLMRVVLSNSEGSYAQMQVGDTLVRLIPSMATVYAYEAYADSCRRAAAGPPKPADKPDAKSKKPTAKPKAKSKSAP
jgi:hypothetical protein